MGIREVLLTAGEVVGFGAITAAAALFGHAFAGIESGIATGLLVGGAAAVYLVNAYAVSEEDVSA